jgi:subtilisin family serine protease
MITKVLAAVAAATATIGIAAAPSYASLSEMTPSQPALGPTLPAVAADLGPGTPTVSIKTESLADAEAVAERYGVIVVRGFPWIDWYELTTPEGTTDGRDFAESLAADPQVLNTDAVAPDEKLLTQFTPRDSAWKFGHPNLPGQTAQWHLAKANFPAAWDVTTGKNVTIGIIDSEFYTTHPELSPKIRNPYNTSSGSPNYHTGNTLADNEQQLHGTHVAGIAAAVTDNGQGISGGGFDALLTPVKITTSFAPGTGNPVDGNFVTDLTEALGYMAGQDVAVINMSLGGTRNHPPLADAIAAVRARGITVVAAAGNFQQSEPNAAIYPASYPGVIAVANTQFDNTINPSSSNGNWVDIAAPGTEILSTWDDRAPGPLTFPSGGGSEPGTYNSISGTSMASPLVAGLVGLMKSARPDLSPDEVEALLKGTATDLGSGGPDPQFGWGLINAFAAVNAAAAYVRPAPPAPPAPPPAPAGDTTAPRLSISGVVKVKKRYVTVKFKCNEDGSGRVRIRTSSKKLLGSKSFKCRSKKRTTTVKVKVKKSLRVRTKIIVEIAAKDTSGNMSTQRVKRKLHS